MLETLGYQLVVTATTWRIKTQTREVLHLASCVEANTERMISLRGKNKIKYSAVTHNASRLSGIEIRRYKKTRCEQLWLAAAWRMTKRMCWQVDSHLPG